MVISAKWEVTSGIEYKWHMTWKHDISDIRVETIDGPAPAVTSNYSEKEKGAEPPWELEEEWDTRKLKIRILRMFLDSLWGLAASSWTWNKNENSILKNDKS